MPPTSTLPEPTGDTTPPAGQALPAGTRVGEYHVLRVLQQNERGIAYLARDLLLQRDVTLYEHLPSALAYRGTGGQVVLRAAEDAQAFSASQKDFVEQMQVQARFDHPAIVAVWRCWHANGTAYAALAHPLGVTLQQARQAMGAAPEEAWIRAVTMPLLDALETVHAASALHLGILPTQVILCDDGRSQMLMFGSTRAGDDTRAADAAFRAPELRRPTEHLPLGAWTDLYAIGALLYHAIIGHAPPLAEPLDSAFAGSAKRGTAAAGPLGVALAAWHGTSPRPSYGMALLRAIDRALAPRPSDRPQSVAQFRSALNAHSSAVTPFAVALAHAGLSPAPVPQSPRAPNALAGTPTAVPAPRAAPGFAGEPPELSLHMAVAGPANGPPRRSDDLPPARAARSTRRAAIFVAGATLLAASVLAGLADWQDGISVQALQDRIAAWRSATSPKTPVSSLPSDAAPPTMAPPQAAADAGLSNRPAPAAQYEPGMPLSPPDRTATPGIDDSTPSSASRATSPTPGDIAATAGDTATPATAVRPPSPTADVAGLAPASPRAVCAGRNNFSLLYCMQRQCEQSRFVDHPQCRSLREKGDLE